MLVSEFAPLASGVFGAGKGVVTLFLLVFSVSMALGSVLVGRLLKGEVSARYVPASALAVGKNTLTLGVYGSGDEGFLSANYILDAVELVGAGR